MTLIPVIDEYACAAHGDCVDMAPKVFALDEIASVTGSAPDETILKAAKACPSAAITVVDAATGRQVYP
jgi:ferredoxin